MRLPRRSRKLPSLLGTTALSFAIGATAIGALAIGALAIGRIAIRQGRIEKLSIGELTVDKLIEKAEIKATRSTVDFERLHVVVIISITTLPVEPASTQA